MLTLNLWDVHSRFRDIYFDRRWSSLLIRILENYCDRPQTLMVNTNYNCFFVHIFVRELFCTQHGALCVNFRVCVCVRVLLFFASDITEFIIFASNMYYKPYIRQRVRGSLWRKVTAFLTESQRGFNTSLVWWPQSKFHPNMGGGSTKMQDSRWISFLLMCV